MIDAMEGSASRESRDGRVGRMGGRRDTLRLLRSGRGSVMSSSWWGEGGWCCVYVEEDRGGDEGVEGLAPLVGNDEGDASIVKAGLNGIEMANSDTS